MHRLPNLFVLRLVLSLMVLIYHLPITAQNLGLKFDNDLEISKKGVLAVYYFFSLSGFLIIRGLINEIKNKQSIDIFGFYVRRMLRIWPVYFLVIGIGCLLYWVILPIIGIPFETSYNKFYFFISYLFFVPNIFNEIYKVGGILNVTWSIGIEEQFYLFFPMLLMLFRLNYKYLLGLLFVILLFVLLAFPQFYYFKNYYFYFIGGGILAAMEEKLCQKNLWIKLLLLVLFTLDFCTNWLIFNNKFTFHLTHILITAGVIYAVAFNPIFEIKNKLLNYLGKISFGIYMYHMIIITPLLMAIKMINLENHFPVFWLHSLIYLTAVTLTFLLAHLSYKYFESKFHKL
jgi:peptidoglycan/LPS O-acetylase OafA/YrhL